VTSARILLVDDDKALLDALPEALRLRLNGIEIDTSETALDALERIRTTDYDAIVSDIKMPGMDGLALLQEIRELRPATPTLMITGHGERDLAVQALRGGAYDFVQKPIDRDYFVASLERAIQLRRLDREVEQQRLALERHARVLENVDDGVFLVDDASVIRHWNPAAHAITGISAEEALDRPAAEALPGWEIVAPLIPVASVPRPGSLEAKVLPLELDGREVWLSISGVTFSDGIVYAFRSLTAERALDELKGEFIATVSHELRTPLAAIYGSAQTLLREDVEFDESDKKRLLDVIAHESERLSRIADDILFANKLDSGQLALGASGIDLRTLARDVVEEMRACFAAREDISFELTVPEALDSVAGDPDRLRQVLINLIDNAVKYSPNGGRVEVAVEARDGGVRIAVRDEGIGIPALEQRRIFGKFYRVDPGLARGVGGTGLGLYICRELVRRMDGRLSVSSEEGKGSTFAVDLPVAAEAGKDAPAVAQPA
jgi:PAS domain S-box-containing protein